jgi:UDP-3-O-[3-hydroxymyristoyl] N-acetylglucosamine deacetylase
MIIHLNQRTVAKPISCSGRGLHSGNRVHLTICPAPVNHGIQFVRTDLPDQPAIPARFHNVIDTSLATVLGQEGVIVSTIEHLTAALAGLSIDNARVELDNYEVPIMDGSAAVFTDMALSAGIAEQSGPKCFFVVKDPIRYSRGGKTVSIYPASNFRVTGMIDYRHPAVGKQEHTVDVSESTFVRQIAPARTFGFLHEVELMKKYGLARGGALENAVVIDDNGVVNAGGLRFENEFVRHKVLDCIGDFSLLGMPILGHVVAEKSGHAFHLEFLRTFFSRKHSWETLTIVNDGDNTQDSLQALAI